jgi:hypothetical protein
MECASCARDEVASLSWRVVERCQTALNIVVFAAMQDRKFRRTRLKVLTLAIRF